MLRLEETGLEKITAVAMSIVPIADIGRAKMRACRYYKDGYCYFWELHEKPLEFSDNDVKKDYVDGKTIYRIRVENWPIICAVCPYFQPKYISHRLITE